MKGAAAGSQLADAATATAAFSGYHQLIFGKEGRKGLWSELQAGGFSHSVLLCVCLSLCVPVCVCAMLLPLDQVFFFCPRHESERFTKRGNKCRRVCSAPGRGPPSGQP